MELAVVIVSWNVRDLLQHCLSSITESGERSSLRYEVAVVDSGSSDGSPDMVRERFPAVRLIMSERNLGFSQGNNLGVASTSGRNVLLLNPDTVVLGDGLRVMTTYMDDHADIGALGPRLLNPDGRVQPSRRRFPTLATAFLESTPLQGWFPGNHVLSRYFVRDRSDEEEQDVDWLVGACLLVRRRAWEQVGPLDERFFMYSEELDWCRRARAAGWRIRFLPTATIVHYEGKSSAQVIPSRHIYFQSSKVYYFRKHHGRLASEVLRCFLLTTYFLQLCLESLKWLVGHKRSLRRARIAAYCRVLFSGLRTQGKAVS